MAPTTTIVRRSSACLPERIPFGPSLMQHTTGMARAHFYLISPTTILSISLSLTPSHFEKGKTIKRHSNKHTTQQNSRTYRTNTSNAGRRQERAGVPRVIRSRDSPRGNESRRRITNEVNFCIFILFYFSDALSLLLQAQFRAAYLQESIYWDGDSRVRTFPCCVSFGSA